MNFIDDQIATFELLETNHQSSLLLDEENAIVKICWKGKISAATAAFLFSNAMEEIKTRRACCLLLDDSQLEEFSKGARVWIREDFLNHRVKPYAHQIRKIATIRPKTLMGSIYSNLISSAIRIAMPYLPVIEFVDAEEPLNWMRE